MSHEFIADSKFYSSLLSIEQHIASELQQKGCPWCKGRLHRADYPRKPRGGLIAKAGEVFRRRISFCCAREGCRKRLTPPSLIFMGRRIYLSVTVILASIHALSHLSAKLFYAKTHVPQRTAKRWLIWWRTTFVTSPFFSVAKAQLPLPIDETTIPTSLLDAFLLKPTLAEKLEAMLRWLAPITTSPHPV